MKTPDEIAWLLGYMPIIARAEGVSDWERQFAISMAGRLKRSPGFTPSDKQISVMARIVDAFRQTSLPQDITERSE